VMEALRDGARDAEATVEADLATRHGVLTVPERERAFWSTHLSFAVEEPQGEDGGAAAVRVLAIFSPQPEIWTAYVFAIGTLAALGFFGTMWAIVQVAMGGTPWALLAPLLAALVGALLYTTTLVGQGLAAGEMYRLRSHLDDCLADAERRARREPATAADSAQL
jgi:hypothetical protein